MLGNGGLEDVVLKNYVDKIFEKYDTDQSGTLDEDQMTVFFNDLFKQLGVNKQVNAQQSLEAIKSIDKNYDGSVDKSELFLAFKAMLQKTQQMQLQTNNMGGMPNYGGQGGYNPYPPQGYYPPPQNYGGYGGYPQSPFYHNQPPPMYGQNPMYGSQGPMYGSAPMYGYGNPNPNMHGNPNPMYGSQPYQGYNPYQNKNPYRQF